MNNKRNESEINELTSGYNIQPLILKLHNKVIMKLINIDI